MSKSLLLIDANSLIHRCFHALPPFTNSKGEPTGALYGISAVLMKVLGEKKPDYVAALFDRPEPTFRAQKFKEYKIQRPKAPDELISQIIEAKNLFENFSIKTFDKVGYEADDLIGIFAKKFKNQASVTILTGDLDSLQLVDDSGIEVETFKKGVSETMTYNEKAVKERYGLEPKQLMDYKGLVGDKSDNIPGVHGVGPKTAEEILQKYRTIENFLEKGQTEKQYEKIKENEKIALLSKELATIITNIDFDVELEKIKFSPKKEGIKKYFQKNNFTSLLKRLEDSEIFSTRLPLRGKSGQEEKIEEIKVCSLSPCSGVSGREEEIFQEKSKISKKARDSVILDSEINPKISEKELNSKKIKVGFDLKNFYKKNPFSEPYFDILIGFRLLGYDFENWEDASKKTFKKLLTKNDFILKSFEFLEKEMGEKKIEKVFYEIEMPLIPVLAKMETTGILADKEAMKKTGAELGEKISESKNGLIKKMGDINLNSPKQLLKYFNEKLNAKIKSTSAQVLEKIKNRFPIIDDILAYRELFKLKTTYLNPLPKLIQKDGRIHPTFLQLGAATGRLSCQNPNLQNIPQESSWSSKIRNGFLARKDFSLVSFDYSQIELRILASLSGDRHMVKAFNKGEDIHIITAQKVFGIKDVDQRHRRIAKTLNFGIIYGMGYRAFSQQSGLPPEQAKEFIKKYFEEFSSVKEWQEKILKETRKTGIVRNLNGRFRDVSGINSLYQRVASEETRMALNMPLQGLAADILKISMILIDKFIAEKNLSEKIKMILTIHDELIFETKDDLLKDGGKSEIIKNIENIMEKSFALKLDVPIETEISVGKKWGEMEKLTNN